MSRHRSFTSVQTVHTHTHAQKYGESTHDTLIYLDGMQKKQYIHVYRDSRSFMETYGHIQRHTKSQAVSHGHSPYCKCHMCRSMSWLKLGVRRGAPSTFSNRFKVLQSAWNLPSEVATPHFLDCISSNAYTYTNIETQVCDPVLGTLRINFQIWFPEAKQQLPKHRTYYIIEGSLEVKLPTIWTDEKQRWEESERREE